MRPIPTSPATSSAGSSAASAWTSVKRFAFATAGVICVGLAGIGAVLPGMPTTVFLLAAIYLFTRSCPYLEQLLIRNRFFAPFLSYLEQPGGMPFRAKLVALGGMWLSITVSSVCLIYFSDLSNWMIVSIIASGVVGSWMIWRINRILGFESCKLD